MSAGTTYTATPGRTRYGDATCTHCGQVPFVHQGDGTCYTTGDMLARLRHAQRTGVWPGPDEGGDDTAADDPRSRDAREEATLAWQEHQQETREGTEMGHKHRRSTGALLLLAILVLLSGCGLRVTADNTEHQIRALSEVLRDAGVQTCTKMTLGFGSYAQAMTIWAGGTDMDTCKAMLYPY